jgi:hypothetical protein
MEVADSTAIGITQLAIPIDLPPQCTAPANSSCIDVLALDNSFPTSKFLVSAVGFADDGRLRYELGILAAWPGSRRHPIALGQQQSVEVTGLPAGNTTLYACAIDDAGLELCHHQMVTVVQPPPAFDASAALLSFDLGTSAQLGMPEALAASSQLFAALVASAAGGDAARPSEKAPDLAALSSATQQAVSVRASQLVMLLANSTTVQDGDGAQQALASAAAVAAVAGELLSTEAQAKLLGVAQMSERLPARTLAGSYAQEPSRSGGVQHKLGP